MYTSPSPWSVQYVNAQSLSARKEISLWFHFPYSTPTILKSQAMTHPHETALPSSRAGYPDCMATSLCCSVCGLQGHGQIQTSCPPSLLLISDRPSATNPSQTCCHIPQLHMLRPPLPVCPGTKAAFFSHPMVSLSKCAHSAHYIHSGTR